MLDNTTSKIFRGIAILMVIASHYAGWMYTEPFNETWRAWISTWGVYGVDIFFMLSGYGLVKAYAKNGIDSRFVIRRFSNSYIPYILIAGFFAVVIDRSVTGFKDVYQLIIGYDYWFMCILFAFYIMFMVFYKIGYFKEILLTVAVIAFSIWLNARGFADFWVVSNPAFLIGVYAATIEGRFGEKVASFITDCNLTFISFALMVVCAFWHTFTGGMSAHVMASIFFTLMALFLCVQFKAGGVVLPVLGRFSLYIYLLHTRIFWMASEPLKSLGYFKMAVAAGLMTLVIAVVLGYVMEFVIGKVLKK